jgi:hypothetical protein
LRFESRSQHWQFWGLGCYKLILTPAIIYLLYVVILNQNSKMIEVAIMESAMAPMITAILATTHGLKPRLSSMIGFGIPISFITLAFGTLCFVFFNFYPL